MRNKERLTSGLVILGAFCIAHLITFLLPGVFQALEHKTGDLFFLARYSIRGREPLSPDLALFSLDDTLQATLTSRSRERALMGESLLYLKENGARTILVDILFRAAGEAAPGNQRLEEATTGCGNVLYPFILKQSGGEKINPARLPASAYDRQEVFLDWYPGWGEDPGILTPYQELAGRARGLGGITQFPDSDGVIREIPLVYLYKDHYLPSLVLAGICDYYHLGPEDCVVSPGRHILLQNARFPWGEQGTVRIPIDARGRMMINFSAPWEDSRKSFSLVNLFPPADSQAAPGALLEDTLVLVGDISSTRLDMAPGIFEVNTPGVMFLSDALNTILTGNYLRVPGPGILLPGSLLLGCLLWLAGWRRHDVPGWLLTFLLLAVFILILFILFLVSSLLPRPGVHILALLISAGTGQWLRLRAIKKMIQSEIPPAPDEEPLEEKTPLPLYMENSEFLLTTKEKEVVRLLQAGLQYKEIANRLKISIAAVGRRLYRMYRKAGVNNKVEFINRITGEK